MRRNELVVCDVLPWREPHDHECIAEVASRALVVAFLRRETSWSDGATL